MRTTLRTTLECTNCWPCHWSPCLGNTCYVLSKQLLNFSLFFSRQVTKAPQTLGAIGLQGVMKLPRTFIGLKTLRIKYLSKNFIKDNCRIQDEITITCVASLPRIWSPSQSKKQRGCNNCLVPPFPFTALNFPPAFQSLHCLHLLLSLNYGHNSHDSKYLLALAPYSRTKVTSPTMVSVFSLTLEK